MTAFEVTDGVHGIDVGLFDDGFVSVYLFDDGEPALVDAGTAAGADRVLDGVRSCGVDPADLQHVVLSHVHLDHAGGAGAIAAAAPEAEVYIHEMTARHLVDPGALVASTRRAMGEHFELMGEPEPVPEGRITEVGDDGTTVDIGASSLELVHAPGHSPDHFAVWNPERDLLFAAECLGGYLERADRWFPPATLPNFDVELLDAAIDRLEPLDPEHVVLPHFGVWPGDPGAVFETARTELHRFDERILDIHEETGDREATQERVGEELLDLGDAYDPQVGAFYARLVTDGYLNHHGLL